MKKELPYILLPLLLLLLPPVPVLGQEGRSMLLHFRFDRSTVDGGYMENARALEAFRTLFSDSSMVTRIDSVVVNAFSSPDGDEAYNRRLALKRSQAVKGYLVWKFPLLDQHRVSTCSRGENWAGLRGLVAADTVVPCREEVLRILDEMPESRRREELLRALDGGSAYRYIEQNLLRYLRNAAVCTVWMRHGESDGKTCGKEGTARNTDTGQAEMPAMRPAVNPLEALAGEWTFQGSPSEVREPDSAQDPDAVRGSSSMVRRSASWGHLPSAVYYTPNERRRQHRPLLALKTNLLFDLALVPNIEIEVPLGKQNRWSVNGEWMFPWWLIDHDKYCLQILSGGVEGRYWLGSRFRRLSRPALTGHFLGFYAGGGKYDLQWDTDGYRGEFYIASGISYGYSTPIGSHLNLEFSIGIGLLRTNYEYYHAIDHYRTLLWQNNGNYTWFGPTKAKISLVWVWGRKRKGGGK